LRCFGFFLVFSCFSLRKSDDEETKQEFGRQQRPLTHTTQLLLTHCLFERNNGRFSEITTKKNTETIETGQRNSTGSAFVWFCCFGWRAHGNIESIKPRRNKRKQTERRGGKVGSQTRALHSEETMGTLDLLSEKTKKTEERRMENDKAKWVPTTESQ